MNVRRTLDLTVGLMAGVVVGLLLFGKTSENRRLAAETAQLRKQLAENTPSNLRVRTIVRQTNAKGQRVEAHSQPSVPGANSWVTETTDEEGNLLEELGERRRRGEYINRFESPSHRKSLKETIAQGVQLVAPVNRTNLSPVFAQLGLTNATSELLLQHVSKINEAAMEVEAMIGQLETARVDYDSKVRSVLSPAQYELYKQYEASGPARRATEDIMRFAQQERQVIPDSERDTLIAIIQDAKAYPLQSYLGPYDGLPVVGVGRENILRIVERQLGEVSEGANKALQLASERGLSAVSTKVLFDYYSQDIRKRSGDVTTLQDPHLADRMLSEARRRSLEPMESAQKEGAHKTMPRRN